MPVSFKALNLRNFFGNQFSTADYMSKLVHQIKTHFFLFFLFKVVRYKYEYEYESILMNVQMMLMMILLYFCLFVLRGGHGIYFFDFFCGIVFLSRQAKWTAA